MNKCRARIRRKLQNILFSRIELDSSFNTKVEEDRSVSPKHDVSEVSRC